MRKYYLFEGPNYGLTLKIPAWTRPVMAIQWQNPTTITVGGETQKSHNITVNGLITKPYELFSTADSYHFFTVEFTQIGLYTLFRDQIAEFVDNSVNISDIIPVQKRWQLAESVGSASEMAEKAKIVNDFLMQFLPSHHDLRRLRHTNDILNIIQKRNCIVGVSEISKLIGLSERHVRRSFQEVTGLSPKKYLRILRFEKGLNQLLSECHAPSLNTDQDYFDQAHFINEFKEFSGFSPSKVDRAVFQFSNYFV